MLGISLVESGLHGIPITIRAPRWKSDILSYLLYTKSRCQGRKACRLAPSRPQVWQSVDTCSALSPRDLLRKLAWAKTLVFVVQDFSIKCTRLLDSVEAVLFNDGRKRNIRVNGPTTHLYNDYHYPPSIISITTNHRSKKLSI